MRGVRRYAFALGPLAAAVLWGGMFVVSKWSFAFIPPVTLGFFRVALGAAALWVGLRLVGDGRRHPLARSGRPWSVSGAG